MDAMKRRIVPEPSPEEFWSSKQATANSLESYAKVISTIQTTPNREGKVDGRVIAWRGVVDASWGLHSSLFRHELERLGYPPNEEELAAREATICADFERWGLHNRERGRMSALDQLAVMQHYGAPTRLIDVTFNAYVALWFAVEQKPASKDADSIDGRVFAIDLTKRLINDSPTHGSWEGSASRPWRHFKNVTHDEWCTRALAWRPAPFERRIAAQQGAFLLGGVPIYETTSGKTNPRPTASKTTKYQTSKGTKSSDPKWSKYEIPYFTSVAIRPHVFGTNRGKKPEQPCYTIRIAAEAKPVIRKQLLALFGYEHRTLFPDYPGFASYGPLAWPR